MLLAAAVAGPSQLRELQQHSQRARAAEARAKSASRATRAEALLAGRGVSEKARSDASTRALEEALAEAEETAARDARACSHAPSSSFGSCSTRIGSSSGTMKSSARVGSRAA